MAASAESIEELYTSRYTSFRGGMAMITGSYETTRDVVQEAFAQALRDREQFRGETARLLPGCGGSRSGSRSGVVGKGHGS